MKERHRNDSRGADDRLAGATILILEDQFEVAQLLEAAVQDAGGMVAARVTTIDDALSVIRQNELSAAIVTMIAGGIYTDMVARGLLGRNVPFIVTTGIGTDAAHPDLHAAQTITKPFQPSHLQDMLARLIDRVTATGDVHPPLR